MMGKHAIPFTTKNRVIILTIISDEGLPLIQGSVSNSRKLISSGDSTVLGGVWSLRSTYGPEPVASLSPFRIVVDTRRNSRGRYIQRKKSTTTVDIRYIVARGGIEDAE